MLRSRWLQVSGTRDATQEPQQKQCVYLIRIRYNTTRPSTPLLADCLSRFEHTSNTHTEWVSVAAACQHANKAIYYGLDRCRVFSVVVVVMWAEYLSFSLSFIERKKTNGAQMHSIVETTTNHLCVRFGRFFTSQTRDVITRLNCNAKQTEEKMKYNRHWVGCACVHVETIKWNGQMSFCSLNTPPVSTTRFIYSFVFNLCQKRIDNYASPFDSQQVILVIDSPQCGSLLHLPTWLNYRFVLFFLCELSLDIVWRANLNI